MNDALVLATDELLRVIAAERLDGGGYALNQSVSAYNRYKIEAVIH
jgi:hypothetical protein